MVDLHHVRHLYHDGTSSALARKRAGNDSGGHLGGDGEDGGELRACPGSVAMAFGHGM